MTLYAAIVENNGNMLSALVNASNINDIDDKDVTPLTLAVQYNHINLVHYLLNHESMNLKANNQGVAALAEALIIYYSSATPDDEKTALLILDHSHQINLEDSIITDKIANKNDSLARLINLLIAASNLYLQKDYQGLPSDLQLMHEIALVYSEFRQFEKAANYYALAAKKAFSLIKISYEYEPYMPLYETNEDIILALENLLQFYTTGSNKNILTDYQAFNVSLLLGKIHLKQTPATTLGAEYFYLAKHISSRTNINTRSMVFINCFTQFHPESYYEKSVSSYNRFDTKAEFLLSLFDALDTDSSMARNYLEMIENKYSANSPLAILSRVLVASREISDLTFSLSFMYNSNRAMQDFKFAYNAFKKTADSTQEKDMKFYAYLLSIVAQFKMLQALNHESINLIITLFESMKEYYTEQFELAYHIEIFERLYELLNFALTQEQNIEAVKLLLGYCTRLMQFPGTVNSKICIKQVLEISNNAFTKIIKSRILDMVTDWDFVTNTYTDAMQKSKNPAIFNLFKQQLQQLVRYAENINNIPAQYSLRKCLIQMYLENSALLDYADVSTALIHLATLEPKSNLDKNHFYTETQGILNLLAFKLLAANSILTTNAINHLDTAIRYAIYPENLNLIVQITQLVQMNREELLSLNIQSLNATIDILQLYLRSKSDDADELILLYKEENYFPALITLTYKHMELRHARRSMYLATLLFSTLILYKDELVKKNYGLTNANIAALKYDIKNYFNSFLSNDKSKYHDLANWYLKFLNLILTLPETFTPENKFDIDALLLGNTIDFSGDLILAVKTGMKSALQLNNNYLAMLLTEYNNLFTTWDTTIQIRKKDVNLQQKSDQGAGVEFYSIDKRNPLFTAANDCSLASNTIPLNVRGPK